MLPALLLLTQLVASPSVGVAPPHFVIDASDDMESGCASIHAVGFPAIDVDAGVIVAPTADRLQLQPSPGSMALEWHDLATGAPRSREAVSVEVKGDDPRACRRALRELRGRVKAINERLAAGAWRPLPRLPVGLLDAVSTGLYRDEVPAARRRIQLTIVDGDLVARIPGVRVLARDALAPRMGHRVVAAHGDREVGVAVVVTMECMGDNCTCDPSFRAQVVRWDPAVFAAIDRAPCDESMPCRADLDFDDGGSPWWI